MARKPVVFIPGYPASEIVQRSTGDTIFPPSPMDLMDPARRAEIVALLSGPDDPPGDLVAGEPIRDVLGIAKQAQSLYDILGSPRYGYAIPHGDDFRPVGWDWRRAVDDPGVQAAALQAIAGLRQANGGAKVVVVAHSTGTLVLRRLLETRPEAAAGIEQALTFGALWGGNVSVVRNLVRGEPLGFWPARLTAGEVRTIIRSTQAAYDLFPPDPAKTPLEDAAGRPLDLFVDDGPNPRQLGPLVDLRWAPTGAAAQVRRLAADSDRRLGARTMEVRAAGGAATPPITNVVGWGEETDVRCTMDAKGNLDFQTSKDGDGTSALASAAWLAGASARTLYLPIGVYPTNGVPTVHSRIWDAPPVLQILDEVLLDRAPSPFVCAAVDDGEMIDPDADVTLRLSVSDARGGELPGAGVLLSGISTRPIPLAGSVYRNLTLPRAVIRPDAQGIFRLVAEVSWTGPAGRQSREVVLLLKS